MMRLHSPGSGRVILAAMIVMTVVIAEACNKAASPVAPTPAPVAATPPATLPVLTLEPDTASPVGQAVAITYASRKQEAGKIAISVTGFNLRNALDSNIFGVGSIEGRLKYDDAVLELERNAAGLEGGDFLRQGGVAVSCCLARSTVQPGLYPFFVGRAGDERVQGSGELFLARFQPRAGVTSATTRIELAPFNANEAGPVQVSFITPLLMGPYYLPPIPSGGINSQPRGNVIDNAYGATVTIRPGS
jgi:hypothetical protein